MVNVNGAELNIAGKTISEYLASFPAKEDT